MSWTGLANNQWVSYNDSVGCGFSILHTLPTTDQWMTKDNLIYYYSGFDTTSLSALTSNQWITKMNFNISTISVLYNDGNAPANVYVYYPNTLSCSQLTVPGITAASVDIAHTANKLWLYYDSNNIDEWNITLSPWSATYNRRITNFIYYSSGLCAINDTKLISVNYPSVYESDITSTTASNTLIFSSLIPYRAVSGDYMLTTTNKFIITTTYSSSVYISQYAYPSGTLEFDIDISSMTWDEEPYGLFEYNNDIFIADGIGSIYKIDKTSPFNTTLITGVTSNIFGASSIPSQLTVHFTGTTTTTTTTIPATTTTTTTVVSMVNWSLSAGGSGWGNITITKNGTTVVSASVTSSGSFVVVDGDALVCIVSPASTHTAIIHAGAGSNNLYNNSGPYNVGYSIAWHNIYTPYNLAFDGTLS